MSVLKGLTDWSYIEREDKQNVKAICR